MNKQRVLLIVGVVILLGAVAFSRFVAGGEDDEAPEPEEVAEQVRTITVQNTTVPTYIELNGRLVAEDRIEIFSEVSGILLATDPPFRAGNSFEQGQTLIRIDDQEFRQSLVASRSAFLSSVAALMPDLRLDFEASYDAWLAYLENFDAQQALPDLPEPATAQERYFLTGRNIYTQFHEIRQMEVRLGKHRIQAPFDGSVAQANITTGTLVQQGQQLGEFVRTGSYELEAIISTSDLRHVKQGLTVVMHSERDGGEWTGEVLRIGEQVDPATQAIRVFVRVESEDLREGMFMTGRVEADSYDNAASLPRQALVDEDRVFVVRDGIARLLQVEVLHRGDAQVVVRGLREGEHVVVDRRTQGFEGSQVEPMAAQAP